MLCVLFAAVGARGADPVDYAQKIRPIFENNCVKCHGDKKDKGDIRLHTPEAIQSAEVIAAGKPAESELYRRITLPADSDDRMPPSGDPLSKEDIEFIRLWIEQGGAFAGAESGAAAAPAPAEEKEEELPNVDPAPPEALASVRELGALVLPLAQDTNRLNADFRSVAANTADEQIARLEVVGGQLTWLNLARSKVSDAGLAVIAKLPQIARLHLELTEVGDAGLEHVKGLQNLEYLNLYGSKVTDAGLVHLRELKKLKKLFVWQTQVTFEAAKELEKAIPGLAVNLGWDNPGVQREQAEKELAAVVKRKDEASSREDEARKEKETATAREEEARKEKEAATARAAELEKKLAELRGEKPAEAPAAEPAAVAAPEAK
jgi:mono/diheme cytochrome c family protein